MTEELLIAIAGIAGRMGRQLTGAALDAGHKLAGGTERADCAELSQDIGTLAGRSPLGLTPTATVQAAAANAQVWVDFTRPDVTLAALSALTDSPVKTVIIGSPFFLAFEPLGVRLVLLTHLFLIPHP